MSTTSNDELLFWHHIENEDYDGVSRYTLSSAEQLRRSADEYLEGAALSGEVTESRIFRSERLAKFVGYTAVESVSGVKIMKTSQGDFTLTAEYQEQSSRSNPGDYQDVEVEIELPLHEQPTVREGRRQVEGHEHTGMGSNRTLPQADRDRVMREVAQLIWQTFE